MKQYLRQLPFLLSMLMLASNNALKAAPSKPPLSFEQQILQKKISPSHMAWSMCTMLCLTLSFCAVEVCCKKLTYSEVNNSNIIRATLEIFNEGQRFNQFFREKWFKAYYVTAYLIGWLTTACLGFLINYALLHLSLKRGWKKGYKQTALALLLNMAAVFSMFCVLNEGLIGFLMDLSNKKNTSFLTETLLLSVIIGSIYVLGWKIYGFLCAEFPNGLLAQDPRIQAAWHEQILEKKISPVNMVWSICCTIGVISLVLFSLRDILKSFFRKKWFKAYYGTAYFIGFLVTTCVSLAINYGLLYLFLKRGWRGAQIPTSCLPLLNIAEAFFMFCVLNERLIGFFWKRENDTQLEFLITALLSSIFIGCIFYYITWEGYGAFCARFPEGFLISDQQVVGWLHWMTGGLFQNKARR